MMLPFTSPSVAIIYNFQQLIQLDSSRIKLYLAFNFSDNIETVTIRLCQAKAIPILVGMAFFIKGDTHAY